MSGAKAIVTGGASGIGAAAARALAVRGHHVVIGDIDAAAGQHVADEIGGTFAPLDVADPVAWDAVVDQHGPFGVAVLNAGIGTGHPLAEDAMPVVDLPNGAYRRIMGINVDGVVFGTRAVLPAMLQAGSGDIVVTASLAGLAPFGRDPVYALTKHAVIGFVRSMAGALEGRGVAVSAICPGFTATNLVPPEARTRIRGLGIEIMSADDVAAVVMRSIDERANGAQWVIWPGQEPHRYEWALPVDFPEVVTRP